MRRRSPRKGAAKAGSRALPQRLVVQAELCLARFLGHEVHGRDGTVGQSCQNSRALKMKSSGVW